MTTISPSDPLAAAMGSAGAASHPTPAQLAPHLPDFEILELLGYGGMGAVYRVRRRSDQAILALKVMRPALGYEEAFTTRFAREAEALERLHHPHIVAIHGHGQGGPWCWLLMDLIDGANLRQIVATGRLSPAQTLALVPPLCAALQYAHDQGVVHRDLKPENILLDAAGVPHLVDFGLAKLSDPKAGSCLTNTGATMGTVHYMAPEQIASAKGVDHRADIYALGVVIYELLTGQLPLGRFENPSQRVQVDVRIDEVVLKALERDPERRWQQMHLVGEAVAAVDQDSASRSKMGWRLLPRGRLTLVACGVLTMAMSFFFETATGTILTMGGFLLISWSMIGFQQRTDVRKRWIWVAAGGGCLVGIVCVFLLNSTRGASQSAIPMNMKMKDVFKDSRIIRELGATPDTTLEQYRSHQERLSRNRTPVIATPATEPPPLFDENTTEAQKAAIRAKLEQCITVDFENTPVPVMVRTLSEKAGINYMISNKISNTILYPAKVATLHARDIRVIDALSALSQPGEFGYHFSGNLLIIDTEITRRPTLAPRSPDATAPAIPVEQNAVRGAGF